MASSIIRVLHPKSQLLERPEFNFYTAPYTDASVKHTVFERVLPNSPLLANSIGQTITLNVPRDPVNYIDLERSYLEVHFRVIGETDVRRLLPDKTDEQEVNAGAKILVAAVNAVVGENSGTSKRQPAIDDRDERTAPEYKRLNEASAYTVINNIGSSMFQTVSIDANNIEIFSSAHYPYLSLLNKLMNCTTANRESVQRLAFFTLEQQSKWADWSFGDNKALVTRLEDTSFGRNVVVYDRLYIPIQYAYKLLPNNVELKLTLIQSRPDFAIIAANTDHGDVKWKGTVPELDLRIEGLVWHVCKVRPYDHILDGNNRRLVTDPALFFFPRRDLTVNIIPTHTRSFHHMIYSGRKPTSITLAMVTDSDAIGDIFTSPFNFQHFGLTRCTLTVNNLLPTSPLEFDFTANEKKWQVGYRSLMESTGHNSEFGEGPLITPEYYKDGNFLIHYSLSNSAEASQFLESAELTRIHLALEFASNHTHAIRLIMLARFDDFIQCVGEERRFVKAFALGE